VSVRVDVVTIFPDYLAPLDLSLPGRARRSGLLDLRVHDLRQWTHDRHRTVDDSPYGGGAGMVMRPEPWGEALDALGVGDGVTLVVPTPSGSPFTQEQAADLATRDHLVLACGRYEGIDQRVTDHYRHRTEVVEVSVGDYVLNGGEAATLVVLEAVVRLLPGFMGNPDSVVEESHADGLLEHPVYTKPPEWRGLVVPDVLRSGDHAAVARWRRQQALVRTAERRPDLAHPAQAMSVDDLVGEVRRAVPADVGELLTLQWACFPPDRHRTVEDLARDVRDGTWFVLRAGGRLVAAVGLRALEDGVRWEQCLLVVAPDLRRRGLGTAMLRHGESVAPDTARTLSAVARTDDPGGRRFYRRAGYRPVGDAGEGLTRLERRRTG
jgi:tRNA (guanine37-N1)-methyltransferase